MEWEMKSPFYAQFIHFSNFKKTYSIKIAQKEDLKAMLYATL